MPTARILAYNPYYEELTLDLRGDRIIDLSAETNQEYDYELTLHTMEGKQATLLGVMSIINQTGPIYLSGALDWRSYRASLNNPDNDVAMVKGTGSLNHNSSLLYVDKNVLLLGNLTALSDAQMNIASVGAGGRSSFNGGVDLALNFSSLLRLDGPWSGQARSEGGPYVSSNGDDGDNRLEFTRNLGSTMFTDEGNYLSGLKISLGDGNATAIIDAYLPIADVMIEPTWWQPALLDMGAGNDRVFLNTDVEIPIVLGEGNDRVRIWDMDTHYHLLDFDGTEDRFLVANP